MELVRPNDHQNDALMPMSVRLDVDDQDRLVIVPMAATLS
jgi:hypothetical protein